MINSLFRTSVVVLLLVGYMLAAVSFAHYDKEKDANTIITVSEMCAGCVKKITKHFEARQEISELKCDIKGKTVTFVPKKNTELSALKMWEEMESIGKPPTKLVGPTGTFTTKPKGK